MRPHSIIGGIMLFLGLGLFGQSNEFVDDLLARDIVPLEETGILILISKDPGFEERRDEARSILENSYGLDLSKATSARKLALLCMEEYEISKGLFFSLTGLPRYAFRDMRFLGLLQGIDNPDELLSGEQVLRIVGTADQYRRQRKGAN